ncbi:methyltransferase domain-containing protein [Haematospirillum sp. H1815]|uniref:tRNA1(Val) (adenine(37)-N6)-methyltransferase n=1 Tax=Haematospirillum sp. H1815 TaxID=2723108 RepID=UPI001438CADC|nr:methyltransferase domain-containing protein [Haematospirillum sp. H1815]NKD77218.1 methyltransferase domain-containing protein [Haematospirillum sp. H1815]
MIKAMVEENKLLGGRVRLLQPLEGYRVALDPVFLAAAVPGSGCGKVLDVGMGTGAAALCLLARLPVDSLCGVELVPSHADLARQSVLANGYEDRCSVLCADLRSRPAPVPGSSFDVVISNPPYHGQGTFPSDPGRAHAHMEDVPLRDWIIFCLRCLKPGGWLVVVHRMDRLGEMLATLQGRAGGVEIIPLWPRVGQEAKRVLVRARKGSGSPLRLLPGLVLHNVSGDFTDAAQAVLRDGFSVDAAMALP